MTKQEDIEELMNSTYLVRNKVSKRDLGIITNPKLYPKNKKKDRNYNKGVETSIGDLKQLSFMLQNLKPHFRNKILQDDSFKNVMIDVMGIGLGKNEMTQQEKDQSISITVQLLSFCLKVLSKNMPNEFEKPLLHHINPLNDLIKAIYAHSAKNNVTIPAFMDLDYPIESDSTESSFSL
jgi:hypothetical protein